MTAAKKTAAKKAPTTTAAEKAPTKTAAKKAPTKTAAKKAAIKRASSASTFSDAERAALKERAEELRVAGRGGKKQEDLDALLAKIAEMSAPDRALAEGIHAIITSVAPELAPKTWYGMPAYAKGRDVLCFFQPAQKFGARYAMLGFNDSAHLDDGTMWPTAFAVTDLSDANASRIEQLVRRAVS